jgi:hypothetical protein
MDNKFLLVKAITLLYRESQTDAADNSAGEIKKIIDSIVLPEISVGAIDTERDLLIHLKHIATEMCNNPPNHHYAEAEMLQKVRAVVRDDESLYESFKVGIEGEMSDVTLKRYCNNLHQDLKKFEREKTVQEIIQKAAHTLKFKRDTVPDLTAFVAEIGAKLEPYQSHGHKEDPAIVDSVSFDDLDSVRNVFNNAKQLNDDRGIMRLGWQALNRMTQGGFRRGECIVIGALQHNFKTGFSLSLFKHIALYNKPLMLDPKKKPLLLRISFEDPLTLNLPFLVRNIKENKTLEPVDIMSMSIEEMAQYVTSELSVNGYHIRMMHVNPSMWTYRDVCNKIIELEAEGYEVHACELDYLAMLPTTGCNEGGPTGSNIRDMFRRLRNFMSARKITLITPHQLSTEAKMLIRQGMEENFVAEIANKGYYDGCRTIDQEVDMELYIHIVKVDGKSFLTIQRGKHRVVKQTPEAYKNCVLPFENVGDIRDDINGPDSSRKRPGANPVGSSEESPFWMIDDKAPVI